MNAGEHYGEGVKGMEWRDTHIRVTGRCVHDLQYIFLSDWIASARKGRVGLRRLKHYFPQPAKKGDLQAQVIANGLYNKHVDQDVINRSYFNLISSATDRLWIQTPYFTPLRSHSAVAADIGFAGGCGRADHDLRLLCFWRFIPSQY